MRSFPVASRLNCRQAEALRLAEPFCIFFMQINREVALEHVDGDSRLLSDLALVFLEDCQQLTGEICNSITQGDINLLERTAHTLKGRLAFWGMERERELAWRLEISGRQGDLAQARQHAAELERQIRTAIPEFRILADDGGAMF